MTNRRMALALFIVLALAALLRVWGVGFGLPYAFEARPDEREIVHTTVKFFEGNLRPLRFSYPGLFYYMLYLCYWVLVAVGVLTGTIQGPYDLRYLYVAGPAALHVTARLLSAAFGVATVFVVWRMGRRCFGRRTGFIAALFLAIAYLHGRDSHFGVTDVALTFFVAAAHLPVLSILAGRGRKAYLLAGLLSGLGTSTKYNAALLAAPVFVAHVLGGAAHRWRALALAGVVCVVAYLATSPYTIIEWQEFWGDLRFELFVHGKQGHGVDAGLGWWRHLAVSLRYGLGLPMCLAALAGAVWLAVRRPRLAGVLLAFPVVYYLVLGPRRTVFVRYVLPLLPSLCLFAAYFVSRLAARLARSRQTVCLLLLCAIVSPSLVRLIQFDEFVSRLDTRNIAAMWLNRCMRPGQHAVWLGTKWVLGAPTIELQARRRASTVVYLAADGRAFDDVDPDFVVVCSHRVLDTYCRPPKEIEERLKANYVLVREYDPQGAEMYRDVYDVQDAFFTPYAGFRGVSRPGPAVRLYARVRPRR